MTSKKIIGCSLLLVLALLVFVGCNGDTTVGPEPNGNVAEDDATGLALIEDKCVSCHTLDQALRERAKGQWPAVVERMVGYKSDLLTEQEQAQVVSYLQNNRSK